MLWSLLKKCGKLPIINTYINYSLYKELEAHLGKGKKFLRVNDLFQSKESFSKALDVSNSLNLANPYNVSQTALEISDIFKNSNAPLEAVATLKNALELLSSPLNPTSASDKDAIKKLEVKVNYRLGDIYYELGDLEAFFFSYNRLYRRLSF